jgi:REP element-mobilizing transposase RayT
VGRDLRTELSDGMYHAYSRGTGPMAIYRDADDFAMFEGMLSSIGRMFGWELYAYCLMPTHYHVLLEVKVEQLSLGMHRLNGRYARYFNRRHRRTGALFQGRFKTRAVKNEEHLERLSLYIPENPLRAGLCEKREDWPFTFTAYEL